MKTKLLQSLLIILFLVTILFVNNVQTRSIAKRLGIGIGYQYFSLKYGLSPNLSIEIRDTFESGIQIYGGRIYYNFNPQKKFVLYTGVEADYIVFNSLQMTGTGYAGLGFMGIEYFITKDLTFNLDVGPTYTKLTDSEYANLNVTGIDWVINSGINLYF